MERRDAADRNLLFGLLALQNGLIDQSALMGAFHAWTRDKKRSIADVLASQGAIDVDERALLEGLAEKHLNRHGNDVEKSLAVLGIGGSTRERLAKLGDPQVDATLSVVGVRSTEHESDRTGSYAVGSATSDGQRFRVLRPHAQGGLGAVFVALDGELNREVALKQILDHHADDPTSRTRFLIEAEITGGLEHPGIVPVYGLGHYGDGRPYYAMRFIRGDSLKEAIAAFHANESLKHDPGKRSLALRKLLRRFVDVCNAIDYAHGRGILHRDLKPGNVIVGKHGETLVVDWGLAKAMGKAEVKSQSDERTLMPSSSSGSAETLPGSAIGTPSYMSPEQACGDLEKLGPRSDVYSLGATLYCLLTGKAPFEGTNLGAVLREVQKGAFPPPREVAPSIDKALEAVCLKAMANNPDDRYATARALADDVERWAADEPTSARREPFSDRARRWMRHNRTTVTAAAVALLAVFFGTAAVLAVQTRANADLKKSNDALNVANARETKANAELTKANVELAAAKDREAARFNLAMEAIGVFHRGISEDFLLQQTEFVPLRNRLLKGASDFYRKLEAELNGQSDRRSLKALGLSFLELGKLTAKVGSHKEAKEQMRRSVEIRRKLTEEPRADVESRAELGRSLRELGISFLSDRDYQAATGPLEEAIVIFEGLSADGAAGDVYRDELAEALGIMVGATQNKNRDGAETLARRALAIREGLVREKPSDSKRQIALARALFGIGNVLTLKDVASHDAIAAYERAAVILESWASQDQTGVDDRNMLASVYTNLGFIFSRSGREAERKSAIDRTIAIRESVARLNPAVEAFQNNLGHSVNYLGFFHESSGRADQAISAFTRGQEILERALKAHPDSRPLKRNLATSRLGIGRNLDLAGRTTEALLAYRRALAEQQTLADLDPKNDQARSELAQLHHNISLLLEKTGDLGASLDSCRRSLEIRQKLVLEKPETVEHRVNLRFSVQSLALLHARLGHLDEALIEWDHSRSIAEELVKFQPDIPEHRNTLATAHTNRSDFLRQSTGRIQEARAGYERAIEIREELVKTYPRVTQYRSYLAYSVRRLGLVRWAAGDVVGAVDDTRKARTLYEGLPVRSVEERYEQACCHAALMGLAGKTGSGLSAEVVESEADQAMELLREAVAKGFRDARTMKLEIALDPLRSRPDFQLLMMDLAFPARPFATK